MKKFSDLVFKPKWKEEDLKVIGFMGGKMSTSKSSFLTFDNGYSVSVITGYGAYGGEQNKYELAVLLDGDLVYPDFMEGDVKGFLEKDEVTELMIKVQGL